MIERLLESGGLGQLTRELVLNLNQSLLVVDAQLQQLLLHLEQLVIAHLELILVLLPQLVQTLLVLRLLLLQIVQQTLLGLHLHMLERRAKCAMLLIEFELQLEHSLLIGGLGRLQ